MADDLVSPLMKRTNKPGSHERKGTTDGTILDPSFHILTLLFYGC